MITTLPSGIAPMLGQKATGASSARNDFNQWLRSAPPPAQASAEPGEAAADALPVAPAELAAGSGPGTALELHLATADGAEQLISIPWGLLASGRLSLQLRRGGEATSAAPASLQGVLQTLPPPVPPYPGATPAFVAVQAPSLVAPRPDALVAGSSREALRIEAGGEASAAGSAASAATVPVWLSRLLRWVERDGSPAAVWVRDYALDADGAQRLAALVRELAEEHGMRLDRIVVNANEIWSAAGGASKEQY